MVASTLAFLLILQSLMVVAPSADAAPRGALQPVASADASLVLRALTTEFRDHGAIADHRPTNAILVTASGKLELIDRDGGHRPFSNLSGIAAGAALATAADGAVYVASPDAGRIIRVSGDGAEIEPAWASLPGETGSVTALHVDGATLLATTSSGSVWRVAAGGAAARIATTGTPLQSVLAIPLDEGRYGPLAGKVLAGSATQPVLYVVDAAGAAMVKQLGHVPRALALIPAHANFFGIDAAGRKLYGAPEAALAPFVGDIVVTQESPGVLTRLRWNGTALVSAQLATATSWSGIAFSSAGIAEVLPVKRTYDALAVVRHAPEIHSGRVEGTLWQLAAEPLTLDGTDTITSDLLVPGTPAVVTSGTPSFGGVIEGSESSTPSGYTITIGQNAGLRHLITRTDPIELPTVALPAPPAGTRDVVLTKASDTPGDFATLRNLSVSGNAPVVTIPAGTYGTLSASGRTTLILGVAGATQPSAYDFDSITLTGGSELRAAGPVVITTRTVSLGGSTIGASTDPKRLVLRVSGTTVDVGGHAVLYAVVRAPQALVTVGGGGRLRGTVGSDRLRVDGNGVLEVTENDVPPPRVNRPPTVAAGADAMITLPNDTVTLEGSATDDGLPTGSTVAVQWTKVSGPGAVTFADERAATTAATFDAPGQYLLRLTADDSLLSSGDEASIVVLPANEPPVVSAGDDQTVELPNHAALRATVSDDGLPGGSTVAVQWSAVSGPGSVTFAAPAAAVTTAAFSTAGTYVLKLTANDGEASASDAVTITAHPENLPPLVDAGPDATIVLPSAATLAGTASDDGWPFGSTLTTRWSMAGGPGTATFADATRASTTATFSAAGTYVLRLTASDTRESVFDDVTVVVDPVNQAPVVEAGSDQTVELPGAASLAGSASDDGWPRGSQLTQTWSVVSGGAVTFADASAASTTATFAAPGTYTLRLTATDGDTSVSDDVVITVQPKNEAPVVSAGGDQIIVLPNPATLPGVATDDGNPPGSTLTTSWRTLSGPGTVTFADAANAATTATFAAPGVYVLRLTATDTRYTASDDVTITVDPVNQAPVVGAGADQSIRLPAPAVLSGSATDDGWPRGSQLTQSWSVLSGGAVTFANASAASTTATFAAAGTYTLRLTATDGERSASDDITIVVLAANTAPTVHAGADATATAGANLLRNGGGDAPLVDGQIEGWSATTGAFTRAEGGVEGAAYLHAAAAGESTQEIDFASLPAASDIELEAFVRGAARIRVDFHDAAGALLASIDPDPVPAAAGWTRIGETRAAPAGTARLRVRLIASAEGSFDGVAVRAPGVATASLSGSAGDDGVPEGSSLATQWSVVSGPAVVAFGDPSRAATTALFRQSGTYVLRLTATDGALTASDDVTIVVAGANRPPVVEAGPAQSVRLPNKATLSATATDDGLPAGSILSIAWTALSGPGSVTFDGGATLSPVVTFGTHGTYVLRLSVSDSQSTIHDDVSITVSAANDAPVVDAGADATITLPDHADLAGVVTDDGTTLTLQWSAVSGPGTVTFTSAADARTSAAFSTAGTYVLRLTASDGELATSDDVVITVQPEPVNRAPAVAAGADQSVVLGDGVTLDGSATDDALPRGSVLAVNWTKVSGPGSVVFGDASRASTTATFSAAGVYVLRLSATDSVLTTSDEVVVTVTPPLAPRFTVAGPSHNAAPLRNAVTSTHSGATLLAATTGTSSATGPQFALDDKATTTWRAAIGTTSKPFLLIRMPAGALTSFDRVRLITVAGSESVLNFRVQVSATTADEAAFTTVLEASATDNDRVQELVLPAAVEARFVRLIILSGRSGFVQVATFEAIRSDLSGIPSYLTPASVSKFSDGAKVTQTTAGSGFAIIDGDPATAWNAPLSSTAAVTIALPQTYLADRVRLVNSPDPTGMKNFRVEVTGGDGTSWTTVVAAAAHNQSPAVQEFLFDAPAATRLVRLTMLDNHGSSTTVSMRELEVVPVRSHNLSASSYSHARYMPDHVLDDDPGTWWQSASNDVAGAFVLVRLDATDPSAVAGVLLQGTIGGSTTAPVREFDVLVSTTTDDPAAFTRVLSDTLADPLRPTFFPFRGGPLHVPFVKLVVRSNYGAKQVEVGTFRPMTVGSEGHAVSATTPTLPLRNLSPAMVANGARVVAASSGTPADMLDYLHSSPWGTANKTNQWVKIELGGSTPHTISGVRIAPNLGTTSNPSFVRDFEIWVSSTTSDDAAFTKVFTGTATNTTGFNRFEFAPVAVRYVKYVPLTTQASTATTIATGYFDVIIAPHPGGVVDASSRFFTNVPELALDGNSNTNWYTAEGSVTDQWVTVAMPRSTPTAVRGVRIAASSTVAPKLFEIRVSTTTTDPSAFTTVFSGTYDPRVQQYVFAQPHTAKYVQFFWKTGVSASNIAVTELDVLTIPADGAAVVGYSSAQDDLSTPAGALDADRVSGVWKTPSGRVTDEHFTVVLRGGNSWLIDHVSLQEGVQVASSNSPRDFEVQVSDTDGSAASFRTVLAATLRQGAASEEQHFFFAPVQARFVRLLVRNNWGGPQIALQTFRVYSPQVGATKVHFVDATSGNATSWQWQFGDGATSALRDPQHQYAAPGVYDVRLTVSDPAARASSYTLQYDASGGPAPDFTITPNPGTEGSLVNVNDTSVSNVGDLQNHLWSWGDGKADNDLYPHSSHAYEDNGSYAITHTVTNGYGISASVTRTVTILNAPPRANAGPDLRMPWGDDWGVKAGGDDPGVADRPTLRCVWDFGDGQTFEQPNCYGGPMARHAYALPGVYTATLTVYDKDGASHSDTLTATAEPRRTTLRYTGAADLVPGQPVTVEAVLRDAVNATLVANRPVVFTMEGEQATAVTDSDGVARATLPYDGAVENPTVTATFAGDSIYQPTSVAAFGNCALNPEWLDIALTFDVSGSIADGLVHAQTAAHNFLAQLKPNDAVAVVSFSDAARLLAPLSLDRARANQAVDALAVSGGTRIDLGLDMATAELLGPARRSNAKPIIILLSDGESNRELAIASADAAKRAGIRIITIVIHNFAAGRDLMKTIASPGDYYVAEKTAELDNIYASIAGTLCTPANRPPVVIAPPDQTLVTPQYTATLDATVRDDGLPAFATLTTTWSKVSGPGNATFANAGSVDTEVTFDAAGTYVLRLTASDTELTRTDDVTISVKANAAPVVSAGVDALIALPPGTLALTGSVADDTIPAGGTLTATWTLASGPAAVTFGDAQTPATTATFTAAGMYVLTLSATDSLLSSQDEVVITVAVNEPPAVSAGADQSATIEDNLLINGGNDVPLVEGAIGGWTAVEGVWTRPAAGTNGMPLAIRGESFFFAGDATTAELAQDVDVSSLAARIDGGEQQFAWSAFARTAAEAIPDAADVRVEYRNADNSAVLLGRGVEITGADWIRGEEINTAPAGTRHIRVRLKVTRRSGTTTDVFIDAVTLRAVGVAQVALHGTAADDGVPAPLTTAWSVASGSPVTFTDPASPASAVIATTAGESTLRLTASDTAATVSDDAVLTVHAKNAAPAVDAGADREIQLPSTATLTAAVSDDARPAAAMVRWELLFGPQPVTFSDAEALSTTVTFTAGGSYRFRVIADDSDEIATDTVTVEVRSPTGNKAPVVDAGADVTIAPPTTAATVSGTVTDDALPAGSSISTSWSQAGGPGTATFADPSARTTTVAFSSHGAYLLRLSATDGELTATDDVVVRYDGVNAAPVVNAGADQTVKLNAGASLAATVTDDNLPLGATLSIAWSKVSGPGAVTFGANGSATTTATFSETGTYVLKLAVSDSELSAEDELTIVVEPALPQPEVDILSPETGTAITDRTTFTGTVTEGAVWRLEYRLNPIDSAAAGNPWTTVASGVGPVNGALGTIDPTLLLNGTYKVRLVASTPDGRSDNVFVSIVVDGELKVGVFRLTFTDVDADTPGLPLQIVRVYDSRDKRVGDFGVGWRVGVTSLRVEKSGPLGTGWQETVSGTFTSKTYCLSPAIPRFVTVTLGNDRVYRFRAKAMPDCQLITPIESATVVFEPLRGTAATLETVGSSDVIVVGSIPGPVELSDGAGTFDPVRFRLTLNDGAVIVAHEKNGIEKMTDRNGNTLTFGPDGIQHSAGRGFTFQRDALGRIVQLTDAANGKITYTYDGRGDLARVKDQAGLVTTFKYNSSHGLIEYHDAAGRRGFVSEYDDSGRLVAVVDGAGNRTEMDYDPSLRREAMRDAKGRLHFYDYNVRGNLIATGNATGVTGSATYDEVGNQLTRTDRVGRTTTQTYDPNGNVLTVRDHDGNTTTYTYNPQNQVTSVTDARGHKVTYEYNDVGDRISETDATGKKTVHTYNEKGQVLTTTDPDDKTRTFTYYPDGQLKSETDSRNQVISYEYDAMGRTTRSVDAKGHATTFTYDPAGKLLTRTDPGGLVTTHEYDASGHPLAVTDHNGIRTETKSDTKGMPTVTTHADGTTHAVTFDATGNLQSSTRTGAAPASVVYDGEDNPKELILGPDVKIGYGVDPLGRVTTQADPRSHTTTYTYNVFDSVASETSSLGVTTEYAHDPLGQVTGVEVDGQPIITYAYDPANRLQSFTSPQGHAFSFEYNWRGDVTRYVDAKGQAIDYAYDGEGNLTTITEPGGGVTSVEYDENGSRAAIQDPLQRRTELTRDEADRITTIRYPDGSAERLTYERGTLVDTATDRAGRVLDFDYDVMGRPSKVTTADGGVTTYTYTPTGRRDVVAAPAGSIDYDYDDAGNMSRIVRGDGSAVVYGYDAAGNRASMATADGTTSFAYDGENRLQRVTDAHGRVTEYTYDANGRVERIDYPNGVTTTRRHDPSSYVAETRTIAADGSVIFGEEYTRDRNGNVTGIIRHDGSTASFAYDDLDRLTTEAHGSPDGTVLRSIAYTYDAAGNRRTVSDSAAGAARTYTYDGELLRSDGRRTLAYDANGDQRSATADGVETTYEYDQRRHLTRVVFGDGRSASYTYDAEGRRVRKVMPDGQQTSYVLDVGAEHARVIAERDSSLTPVATYTYGHEIVSMERGGETYYYVLDAHGSVRALTDSSGNVTDRYTYTAFGELAFRSGTTTNPFLYAGEQLDAESGLYYLRARYYDPSIGRLTQWDSYGGNEEQPQTRNRYTYALNNPVNMIDPSGHVGQGIDEHVVIGKKYIMIHGDYFYKRLRRNINKGFPQNGGKDGWGAFDRYIRGMKKKGNKRKGEPGSKPDVRHYSTGEVHEIKPLNYDGWRDAPREAAQYVDSLHTYENDEHFPGEGLPYWQLGASWRTWPPFYRDGKLAAFGPPFTPEGSILYSENWQRDVKVLLEAAKGVKDLATQYNLLRGMRLIRKAPMYIEQRNRVELEQRRKAAMSMPASMQMFLF